MSDPTRPGKEDQQAPEVPKAKEVVGMFIKALVAFVIAGVVLTMLAFGACVLMMR